tara:strand:- start:322 stop:576 length:255 start_codon:yes stop_codon:yes gene_type:complete
MNYKYGYTDTIQETRHFDIESHEKLTEDEVREVTEECITKLYPNFLEKGYVYFGKVNNKNCQVEYLFSEYEDDTKEQFTGDEYL